MLTKEVEYTEGRQHQLDGGQAYKGDAESSHIGFTRGETQLHPHLRIHIKVMNPHRDNRVYTTFHEVQHQEALGATCVPQTDMVPGGKRKRERNPNMLSSIHSWDESCVTTDQPTKHAGLIPNMQG